MKFSMRQHNKSWNLQVQEKRKRNEELEMDRNRKRYKVKDVVELSKKRSGDSNSNKK